MFKGSCLFLIFSMSRPNKLLIKKIACLQSSFGRYIFPFAYMLKAHHVPFFFNNVSVKVVILFHFPAFPHLPLHLYFFLGKTHH